MKWILVALLAVQLAISNARPGDGLVEIERQRLVKFPEETFPYDENEEKSSEAKRILEEINKINVALGYVKKQEKHLPSILDSNQFLFPKPSYHPFQSQGNGGILQPSIRNLNLLSNPHSPKSIESTKPNVYLYYYIPKSVAVSSKNEAQQSDFEVPVKLASMTKDEYISKNNPREFKLIDYKVMGDVDISHDDKQENVEPNSPKLRLYFVPRQLKLNEKPRDYLKDDKLTRIQEKLPTVRPYLKATTEKQRPNTKSPSYNAQKQVTAPSSTTTLSPPISSLKTPFASFFKRPANVIATQQVETKPILQSVPLSSPQSAQQQAKPEVTSNDDYRWDMESSEESDYPQDFEKHIFSAKRKEMAEVQKEALKESGIIIQRLKVRKGGIAIAGPGGVATAGSGGTAIVGPGGYALTHPRSLTIAGPGAKIIAIPETTDLKDALLRTNSGKSYTDEGEVVATGPIIYYSPDDNTQRVLSASLSIFNTYLCELNAIYNRRQRSVNRNGDVVSFPYYGGLKGHSLNVRKDGKVNTVVVLKPQYAESRSNFDSHFNKIQEAAARLVAIQELAKQKGTFSQEDNKFYADSLFELGVAAQNLAQLQQNGEIKDFSKLLQGSNTQNKPQPSNDTPAKPVTDAPNQSGDAIVPISQDDPYEDFGDSVSINAPKKDASVAEAKPVGLSIAGEGGVASSKPNAVAIAGREGLAVASPRATAIAGVSPEEAAAFSINVHNRNHIIIKNKELQGQENASSVLDDIKSSAIRSIPSRSMYDAKSKIAAAVDDYDVIEEVIEAKASDTLGKHSRHQSPASKVNIDSKSLKVYQIPAKYMNRFIPYPGVNEPYVYVL